jgi:sterol desaturase/sphingolipid hydroxylase (fatty acid hydroxylase superfamily)
MLLLMEFQDPKVYLVPLGMALILLEAVLSARHDEHLYEWRDSAASAGMGLVATLLGIATKAGTLAVFYVVFTALSPVRQRWLGYDALSAASAVVWVLVILGDDLSFYWHHRLSHTVRVLWAAHVVHHSSQHFNLGTAFRNGWVIFFYKPIFWLWLPALGFPPVMVVLAMSINSLYQFFLHSQKIPHLGWAEKVFNTPQLHQVHHSCNHAFLDKNHGGILIVWDRLFGTYLDSRHPEVRQFGVLSPPASFHPWTIFAHEFQHLGHDVRQAASWSDKLKYVFYPPGWAPNNSGQTARQLQQQLAAPETLVPAPERAKNAPAVCPNHPSPRLFFLSPMHTLTTLSQTLARLKKEGYTEDFNLHGAYLAGQRSAILLAPEEFVVDQHFRFEGPTDPADEAVLYAISSARFNLKGTLVNGYVVSSDEADDQILRTIREQTT